MRQLIKHFRSVDRWAYLTAVIFIFMLLVSIGLLCTLYYNQMQDTIRTESKSYLQELSLKTGAQIQKIVSDNYSILDSVELVLRGADLTTSPAMQGALEKVQNSWNYRDLLLIDADGNALGLGGEKLALTSGSYLSEVLVERRRTLSTSQVIHGEECVLFVSPTDNLLVDGLEVRAIGVTYLLSSFDTVLQTSAFGGQAYTHVINRDGTMVIPSSSNVADLFGYNVLTSLEQALPERDWADVEQMRADILNGVGDQIECQIGGVSKYVTYQPMDISGWYLLTIVPVSVVNAQSVLLLNITLWFCIFITIMVSVLVLLLTLSFFRNKRKLETIAYVDPITGGHTVQRFTELSGLHLRQPPRGTFAMVYINVEKFRLINEQFGREAGDKVLRAVHTVIAADLQGTECMCHAMNDHFYILLDFDNEEILLQRLSNWYDDIEARLASEGAGPACPAFQFGVYLISEANMPLPLMIDRAKFSLRVLKPLLDRRLRYAIYDDSAHLLLVREKQLEDRMEKALVNHEFLVYLQPKYRLDNETVGGAEALVRWNSPEEGMIFPDEFIPLFEKNGFVISLDLFVFEEVCRVIRGWLDQGLTPFRVSVNCSRVHFAKTDFLLSYLSICEKYHIPMDCLEIELTEGAVYENMQRLSQIIDEIHAFGFQCAVDDFGSGYSSLNMIQDIPTDTLKLDKIFFRSAKREDIRTRSVVESIIRMAQSLSMETVAEGVEYQEQVEMLKQIGCDYIQGYYYAKPMPISEFETLAFGSLERKPELP